MIQVINGKRYDSQKSTTIGTISKGTGRTTTLEKTKKGNFFFYHDTQWQGEVDSIEPISKEEAIVQYGNIIGEADVDYESTFGEEPEEA